jgi:hypothetical protein
MEAVCFSETPDFHRNIGTYIPEARTVKNVLKYFIFGV